MYRVIGYWTVYCTQSGGSIFFQNTKVTCTGGCLYFPLKHKSAMYTFVQQRGGGGSRRDPNHKSMYKCAYMYLHLSLSPPPPPPRYYWTFYKYFQYNLIILIRVNKVFTFYHISKMKIPASFKSQKWRVSKVSQICTIFKFILSKLLSRRWQAPGAVKKEEKKSEKKSCQFLYMFLSLQSKKPNLRRRLNHVPIN